MPNFMPRPRGGLITPPGSEMYGYRSGQTQYGQNARKSAIYDPSAYPAPAAPMMYQPPMQYNNMPTAPPPGMARGAFGPIGQPTLPPLDRSVNMGAHGQSSRHTDQRRQQPAAKQEKIVGGVAQELDYEMDQMTDYVSQMAQEIVMPRSKVSAAFRKFVSGLLSSTRLPSSTILLGLNYLAKRITMLGGASYKATDGQVWRMLTIALLLGSKFLDDNTFQNRSWSEVSGIPVPELNTLESEWLVAIDWNLHVNPDTDSDFQCWLASWASWKESKNLERSAVLDRLAPLSQINTNVQRQHSQRKGYSPPQAYPSYNQQSYIATTQARPDHSVPAFGGPAHFDRNWVPSSAADVSPPSAPESGPNTPDWAQLPGSGLPPTDWYGYQSFYNNRRPMQPAAHVAYVAPYHTPSYNNHYSGHWQGHPIGCACGYCNPGISGESYNFMAPAYGQQTVAG